MQNYISNYYERTFSLTSKYIKEISKIDTSSQIGNVIRGLSEECFGLMANFDTSNEISFFYITYTSDITGSLIRLNFREEHFYEYLLMFSVELSKDFNNLQPIDVYDTLIGHLRTLLEANGFITFTTSDFKKFNDKNPLFIATQPVEIIKNHDKIDFYKRLLGVEGLIEIQDGLEYVYLMLNKDSGYFKIGQSKKPTYRERTLQSKEPEVEIVKIWNCDKKIERLLHKKFIKKKIRGEWFNLDFRDIYDLNKTIEELHNLL